jgi:hypothetical protein
MTVRQGERGIRPCTYLPCKIAPTLKPVKSGTTMLGSFSLSSTYPPVRQHTTRMWSGHSHSLYILAAANH